MSTHQQALVELLEREKSMVVDGWLQAAAGPNAPAKMRAEADEIFGAFLPAIQSADAQNSGSAAWQPVKAALERLSASRAAQGSTAGSTSAFVLALKQPIFEALQRELASDTQALIDAIARVSLYVDALAQWTMDAYQRTREQLIKRQQEELLELSTPVIKLWDGVLAVPMIGTLDSSRTQLVMESLLQRIVETESSLAIIDITGVPTVDTLVAQHLLKTVTAIRLMGADCIICGIRPQIAQTIVHLGIDLNSVTTKATLADALALAMKRNGYIFTKTK
ncbi:STAS domain-containing protein [Comamonas piscis]|uniref:STAS domain-containing protein n=1 Tax=Comamonas piscis TaxID=1562974 RepID=A0A7G5EH76_9BURK|nr:STAS domain-containing protein [Comamonas piscis]QMV73351.1 STAS domain-containing protein [Comamonas piscis]WSO36154.1 STAS domain-containing protein [Comamonas piscis]